jgi:hypothetical protein
VSRADIFIDIDRGRLAASMTGSDGVLSKWLEQSWARQVTARAVMRAPVDTGNLRRNIHPEPVQTLGPFRASVAVVSDADYSLVVHEGIASPRNRILPTRAKALRFVINGKVLFRASTRVSDKQRSRPFLRTAAIEVTAQLR